MRAQTAIENLNRALRWLPFLFLAAVCIAFAASSPRILSRENIAAILMQSSWLMLAAMGVNFVLLTAGVDLSVGAVMYLAAVIVGMEFSTAPVWLAALAAILIGGAFGCVNGSLVVHLGIPPFVVTLSTAFIGRGLGLYFSSTKVVNSGEHVAALGRSSILGIPGVLWLAAAGLAAALLAMHAFQFGGYVRAIGADSEGARRTGVPVQSATWSVYLLCGAFAGLAGLVSIAQTASASPAFGVNAEFLAIAASVLGGTSLFGGRGSLSAPIVGAILIITVQNGMALINANPYAYPVMTGVVIFIAVALDSLRSTLVKRIERRRIRSEDAVARVADAGSVNS